MTKYGFDAQGRFVVEDYNRAKPFASFLPGVAGLWGKPMWAFYVSRGQAMAGFGVRDKDGSMMEFFPANKAYAFVGTQGFRTFLRLTDAGGAIVEPFGNQGAPASDIVEKLLVSPGKVGLSYSKESLGLAVDVTYFTIPGENFAGLARRVKVTNTGTGVREFEILDGLAAILPYGTGNFVYKELGNTIKAWMDVYNLEEGIPYYKLRAGTGDSAEVTSIKEGHFLLASSYGSGGTMALNPIVDASVVFGRNTSFAYPDNFASLGLDGISAMTQVTANKVPCGFVGRTLKLSPGESACIEAIYGHTPDIALVNARRAELSAPGYLAAKEKESDDLIRGLTDCVDTHTANPAFDAYIRQCYLDNMLRGGKPVQLGVEGSEKSYHVYSRKHGDLERDYNFFSLQPSYYSQGNGNFRDANQNRRNDVLIDPRVQEYNIRTFSSLIQTDGYNPLVVRGCTFSVPGAAVAGVAGSARAEVGDDLAGYLKKPFTPGELLAWLEERGVDKAEAEGILAAAVSAAEQHIEADFGEGYWIDHWTYNLDLIETYLAVYPDRLRNLLLEDKGYAYYDSPGVVLPRSGKHVLAGEDKVRQYGALSEDGAKHALISGRSSAPNWVRTKAGMGDVYRTNLMAKLVHLALVKAATLDPQGLGMEMEAGRPGWNDSLNGLPGIFASGLGETAELLRLVKFLQTAVGELQEGILLPVEAADLMAELSGLMAAYPVSIYDADGPGTDVGLKAFEYWDVVSSVREAYRDRTKPGLDGAEKAVSHEELTTFLTAVESRLASAIRRSGEIGRGLYPTFYYYEATAWEPILGEGGKPALGYRGMPLVKVKAFRRVDLPKFLEGPARVMKVLEDSGEKARLHSLIRKSHLYDEALGMYRTNESLAPATLEMGRSKAFTPGWLENESVFMHMEYKYLLELLKGGLYEEFFADMQKAMVPFLDPAVYGRSTLENSSFIASSSNPDPSLHGTGFVARLSGSTAELLSMWIMMMTGGKPFVTVDSVLALRLRPILPGWLFDSQGQVRFRFLGTCDVTYSNPGGRDTFGSGAPSVTSYTLTMADGRSVKVDGPAVTGGLALDIREGRVAGIAVTLG